MSRLAPLFLVLVALLGATACGDSSDPEPAGGAPAADFCVAAADFAEAEAAALEQDDSPDGRRAAALASVEAYATLAAAAPQEIRAEADTALEGQRGIFEAQNQIGWGEDALNAADSAETDELLTELERFYGDEYFAAEEVVVARVRAECDPAFLEG